MALLNIFRGTQAEVSARPVSDGALLFATDTKKIYLDKGSDRIEMSSVEDLSDYVTSSELEGLLVVATTEANGLMSAADKTKLDGIADGANNYVHPASAAGAKASGFYKVAIDTQGHVTAAVEVAKNDITALGIPAQDTNTTYTAGTGLGLSGTEFSIANNGVTTAKLADDSVTAEKIADGVIPDVSGFITSDEVSNSYAAKSHTHDDRYYTETEVDGLLDGKADVGSVTLTSLGVTATADELNYMDGVTSNVQTQLNAKAASSHSHTVSQISDLTVTAAELNTLDGITSNVQTQLDTKTQVQMITWEDGD